MSSLGFVLNAMATIVTIVAFSAFLVTTKNKVPLYFKLPIGAIGCFALHQISTVVKQLCGSVIVGDLGIGVIGILGFFCFILSANYGQIDGLVDDRGSDNKKAKIVALIAPAMMILIIICAVASLGNDISKLNIILFIFVLSPILPASYFCLKHLVLPMDDFGFLKSSRMYNVVSIIASIICIAYLREMIVGDYTSSGVLSIAMSSVMVSLFFACRKGVKIWQTLI